MKKLLSVLLVLALAISLCACAGNNGPAEENEIGAMLREGYSVTSSTYNEDAWKGLLQKDGGTDVLYRADAKMTAEIYAEMEALDFLSDDYDSKWEALLNRLPDVQIRDITGDLPSQEELNTFVGMTFGELEDAGYENTGNLGDDSDVSFFYDGPLVSLLVKPVPGSVTELDDLSANDLRALVIGSVQISGVSSMILDD